MTETDIPNYDKIVDKETEMRRKQSSYKKKKK